MIHKKCYQTLVQLLKCLKKEKLNIFVSFHLNLLKFNITLNFLPL